MDNHCIILNGIDFDLQRLTDIQLDTIHRSYPDNLAVNAEWQKRQPSPPCTAPESETFAHRITAIEAIALSSKSGGALTSEMDWEPTQWKQITPPIESLATDAQQASQPQYTSFESQHLQEGARVQVPEHASPLVQFRTSPSLPEVHHPLPLRQELISLEDNNEDSASASHFGILQEGNRIPNAPVTTRPRSWIQQLVAQNILFNALQVMNPVVESETKDEDRGKDVTNEEEEVVPKTPYNSDGEGDADEEDNVEGISKELEAAHLEGKTRGQRDENSQEMDEGGYADDEDSNFEPAEPGYVLVDGRFGKNIGSWNLLRTWNRKVRRGSRCPGPIVEEYEKV